MKGYEIRLIYISVELWHKEIHNSWIIINDEDIILRLLDTDFFFNLYFLSNSIIKKTRL